MPNGKGNVPSSVEPLFEDERFRADSRILANLLMNSLRYSVTYEKCFSGQTDVTHAMRAILLGWLRDVCVEKRLADDTFTLACNLVDRYSTTVNLHRSFYQLVGGTCLLIASKLRDPTPITSMQIANFTERTVNRAQLLEHERLVARNLNFDLDGTTAWDLVCYVHRLFVIPGIEDDQFRRTLRNHAKQFIYAVSIGKSTWTLVRMTLHSLQL